MSRRISLSLVLHNHQPVGNFGWVFQESYERAYEPMVAALERHPGVRVGLHYTGPLLEWLRMEQPAFLDRIRALVARDQVEILGGGYYEPVLASLPQRDRHGQLLRMADELEREFGARPRGAWLAERVWEPSLPFDLARAGYGWTVVDDNHLRAAAVKDDAMWGAYTTDDQGQLLTIFGSEQGLRYRIPWVDVDDLIGYLRDNATEAGDRLGTMGDDGEKFGGWPETYELCWGKERWVERCFEALEENADWLSTVTPSGWLAQHPPIGRVYIPTASYIEMTQWALPEDEASTFARLLDAAKEKDDPAARFLRGAMWRNFQSRYSEVNDLHKRMLRVSDKVDAMPPGPDRDRALDHLYQGQSNDCYWHGVFGGVYIVHMRMATLQHLIAAEDIADRAAAGAGAASAPAAALEPTAVPAPAGTAAPGARSPYGTALADVDLDGVDEVHVSTPAQSLAIDLAEGAGIRWWDLRASQVSAMAVMRRRREAYHEALIAYDARVAAGPPASTGATTGVEPSDTADDAAESRAEQAALETVRSKEPNLSRHLHYDRHERLGALVHILGPGAVSADELLESRYAELGDFVSGEFTLVEMTDGDVTARREGTVRTAGRSLPLTVVKRLRAGGERARPFIESEVRVVNASDVRADLQLGLEWGFNMSGGGGNPAAYYLLRGDDGTDERLSHDSRGDRQGLESLAFGNEYDGVRVDATFQPAARAIWYPLETISNSEGGYERIYQGSALMLCWPLALAPGEERTFTARFAATEERDRADE